MSKENQEIEKEINQKMKEAYVSAQAGNKEFFMQALTALAEKADMLTQIQDKSLATVFLEATENGIFSNLYEATDAFDRLKIELTMEKARKSYDAAVEKVANGYNGDNDYSDFSAAIISIRDQNLTPEQKKDFEDMLETAKKSDDPRVKVIAYGQDYLLKRNELDKAVGNKADSKTVNDALRKLLDLRTEVKKWNMSAKADNIIEHQKTMGRTSEKSESKNLIKDIEWSIGKHSISKKINIKSENFREAVQKKFKSLHQEFANKKPEKIQESPEKDNLKKFNYPKNRM